MKTLLDIYDEVDANDIIVYEHKIGDRKSAIIKTEDWTAITVNRWSGKNRTWRKIFADARNGALSYKCIL